jgi:hypothetical protein
LKFKRKVTEEETGDEEEEEERLNGSTGGHTG